MESISSNGSRDIAKSLTISFGSSLVSLRAFGSKFWQFRFPVYTFQTKKTALDYLSPFLSFSVHNFCARTDAKSSKKFPFFSSWSRIYTPISIIFQISPPCDQSLYLFFHIGNRYEKHLCSAADNQCCLWLIMDVNPSDGGSDSCDEVTFLFNIISRKIIIIEHCHNFF